MTIEEALNLIRKICANYKGTLQEHQLIQQALQLIEKECSRVDIAKEEPTDTE